LEVWFIPYCRGDFFVTPTLIALDAWDFGILALPLIVGVTEKVAPTILYESVGVTFSHPDTACH